MYFLTGETATVSTFAYSTSASADLTEKEKLYRNTLAQALAQRDIATPD